MKIISYCNHVPRQWLEKGSFLDRNPNMSYLVVSDEKKPRAVLIDASVSASQLSADLKKYNAALDYILLTHHHGDHMFALADLLANYPEARVGVHQAAADNLRAQGLTNIMPFSDGMSIVLGSEVLKVVFTPGHTFSSVCFADETGTSLFTGDTLFGGSIGCADYSGGGNRNIFYQTIKSLFTSFSEDTLIYPGHFSEHYKTLPPYGLDGEIKHNPYVVNALAGRRGSFDRALKEFSIDFETEHGIMLDESYISQIMKVEKAAWIPELQASEETVLTRLRNNHNLVGYIKDGELQGMVGWCYSRYSINEDPENFPSKFAYFSTSKACTNMNARSAFIYNVGVKMDSRHIGTGSLLLQWAFERIKKDGVSEVFLDSRMPAYNGSEPSGQEKVLAMPEFKKAIDNYFDEGIFPAAGQFMLDPRIRFYMKNGFNPWRIFKDFIQDPPSDNKRVICFINLEQE